jgi:hypothetical protein
VLAGINQVAQPVDAALVSQFEQRVAPTLQANDVPVEGIFVTESSRNITGNEVDGCGFDDGRDSRGFG